MLRTRAVGGGLGRLCGWTGPAPAVGGAGLPLGLLLSPPASSSSAAAVAPASLLGGLSLVGHRPSPPSSTAIPALLRISGLDGDRHHRQQQPPPPLASTMAAAGGRWGWRQAAAVQQQQQQALVQARGRRPFGTRARSTTGGSSAEGGAGGGGSHGGPPGGSDGKQAGAGVGKDGAEGEEEGEGKVGKIRLMVRRYGPVAIVTYLGVYVTTLGLLFGAVEAGVNPFDYGVDSGNMVEKATGMLEGYSWGEPVVEAIRKNPHVGNFALAWILTKFTEPLRALVTIGIVPRIARALGRAPPLPRRGD